MESYCGGYDGDKESGVVTKRITRTSSRIQAKLSPLKIKLTDVVCDVTRIEDDGRETAEKTKTTSKSRKTTLTPAPKSSVRKKVAAVYSCDICGFEVKRKFDLKFHIRFEHNFEDVTSNANVYSCDHCVYTCKRKYDIQRHISKVHFGESEELMCAICEQTFAHKVDLRKHVFSSHFMHRNRPTGNKWRRGYCCDVCSEGFQGQKNMLAHRTIMHAYCVPLSWSNFRVCLSKLKSCDECNKHFKDGKYFDQHTCVKFEDAAVSSRIKEALEAKPSYKCDKCSMCFQWKWIYRLHRENVHPEAEVEDWESVTTTSVENYCPSCNYAFETEVQVKDHQCTFVKIKDVKRKSFHCNLCGNSYCRKSDYKRHRRFKHLDLEQDAVECDNTSYRKKTSIKCPYCDATTATRNGILVHIKEVHDIETDTPFVCVPCNKVFKRKATMDTHNQVYHPKEENVDETNKILQEAEILLNGEQAYHCNICNRNMFNSIRFVAHYRLHYVERKFTCDLCGKQTRTQHQLNSHIKIIHLNIRNYECDICGKSFHAKQSCEEHRRIHTGERPFSCEICGKTFVAMNALFTHKKFHNDFYAHPCSMCDKKFKVRRSLINHIRTHTGERPFKCELCPKTFNNSSRFSYHKKVTHSDARPFSCSLCGSCFKANKFLMRHMKLHNVRTHIQFRRRNNPAYFAAHASNPKLTGGQGQKKNAQEQQSSNREPFKTEALVATDTNIYNLQRPYDTDLDRNNESATINEPKNHFLNEAFDDDDAHVNFNPPTTGNNGKHITCL